MRKEVLFDKTAKCQEAFNYYKNHIEEPILKYADPEKLFISFTDASKYAWACVLTQSSVMSLMERHLEFFILSLISGVVFGKPSEFGRFNKRRLCYIYIYYMCVCVCVY